MCAVTSPLQPCLAYTSRSTCVWAALHMTPVFWVTCSSPGPFAVPCHLYCARVPCLCQLIQNTTQWCFAREVRIPVQCFGEDYVYTVDMCALLVYVPPEPMCALCTAHQSKFVERQVDRPPVHTPVGIRPASGNPSCHVQAPVDSEPRCSMHIAPRVQPVGDP